MLFNIDEDPFQKNNLAKKKPDKLNQMISDFVKIRGKNFSNIKNLKLE